MAFNFDNITDIEFFIQKEINNTESYYQITLDANVNPMLKEMLSNTSSKLSATLTEYSPTQKYCSSSDKLQTSLQGDYATNIRQIYNLQNITVNNAEIQSGIEKINYYFGKYTDNNGNILLGIKKATYFKAFTANHNRLISWAANSLKQFNQNVFKLDQYFDILVYDDLVKINNCHIFEGLAELASVVKAKSVENISSIETSATCLAFSQESQKYVTEHITAARLVASISKQNDLNNLNITKIQQACTKLSIDITTSNGKISFDKTNTLDFLKLLDRRLYSIDLTGTPEIYEAKNKERKQQSA